MGFFARFFGAVPRTSLKGITPEQLGHTLFDRAISRLPDHHADLEALGAFAKNPSLSRSKGYMVTFIVFVIAPLDQVLADVPMPEVRAARATVRALLLEKFQAADAAKMNSLVDGQIKMYTQAVRSRNVPALGRLAAQATGLPETPDIENFLADCYTSALNFWLDALGEFGIDTS